jgi:hypothetical protein
LEWGRMKGLKVPPQICCRLRRNFACYCEPTTVYPLPKPGNIRFYLMGPDKIVTEEANAQELSGGRHALSPLFSKCNALLTEIRLVDQKLKAKLPRPPATIQ